MLKLYFNGFARNQIFKVMNELVYRKENQVLTNSRLVAMKFGKDTLMLLGI